jgi:hypothetical protein
MISDLEQAGWLAESEAVLAVVVPDTVHRHASGR